MSEDTSTATAATEEETEFPRNWMFDEDGPEVRGKFVKFSLGQTKEYGECPIVVLNVDGEERSVWLFHSVLKGEFQREVNKREVQPGEQINIKKVGQKKGAKYTYTDYAVAFVDAPPLDAKAIFGPVDPIDQGPTAYGQDELPTSEDW